MIPPRRRSSVQPIDGTEGPQTTGSSSANAEFPDRIDGESTDDRSALARALEPYRDYLSLVAARAIGPELAPKIGASDIVQETFLAAQRHIGTFRGRTEAEWRAWLKAILLNHLANQRRCHAAVKRRGPESGAARDPRGEASAVTPPSRRMMRRERDLALAEALDRLPQHYRQVVCWHHYERLGFGEIAARLRISADAAQKLWGRALACLKRELGPDHDPR
jgi:RNA polymerase sigma-70 factor (ECF subfamily)